jgi:hypothetical protein
VLLQYQPSGPETVHSVKVFNLVLQINKQTDDSALLDIQTRLSDKKKREISDCFNDTLTNPCGQKFAKTTLPSNTENMSNVGSNENNLSDFNTTDVGFLFADTDLQALFDNDFELENVPPANVPSNPVRSVQSMPVQFNSLRWRLITEMSVMPVVSNYNCTVHFNFYSK